MKILKVKILRIWVSLYFRVLIEIASKKNGIDGDYWKLKLVSFEEIC
jgi:hypothetical protein